MLLWGEAIGPNKTRIQITFPSGSSSGQAGFVFGYKRSTDYWLRVLDLADGCCVASPQPWLDASDIGTEAPNGACLDRRHVFRSGASPKESGTER